MGKTSSFYLNASVAFSLLACMSCSKSVEELPFSEPENPASSKSKPNILLIITDQQSYNTISAHRSFYGNNYSQTPNIDRIANSGVSFTQAYCANPVSVPSRFSLFTGMYGGRYNIRDNNSEDAVEATVRSMLATHAMGNVFKNGGYETYYGGKVHLPFSASKGTSKFAAPSGYGFDEYLTRDERAGLGKEVANFLVNRKTSEKPFLLVASFLNPHDICLESSTNLSEEIVSDDPEKVATVRMMRGRLATYDPVEFYRDIAPALPQNSEKTAGYPNTKCSRKRFLDFPDWYWQKYRWIYGEMVSLVDQHIGEVLDSLDRNPELKKNTLIVFTSDHGEMQGAHHTVTKSLPYEECQRVPFIFAGAGVPQSRRENIPVCNGVDLLPTLCELVGIQIPQNGEGISLAGYIKGNEVSSRNYLYMESETFVAVLKQNYKYTYFDRDGKYEMLIDLAKDKGEMKNIMQENPLVLNDFRSWIKENGK